MRARSKLHRKPGHGHPTSGSSSSVSSLTPVRTGRGRDYGHPTSGSSSSVSSLTPVRTGRGRDFRCYVRHPREPVVPVEAVQVVVGFVQAAVQVVQFGRTGQRLHCIAGGQRVWDPGCRRRRGPGRCGRYCRVSVPKTSTFPQPSLLAVWRKRAVLPENVSIAGACVMVPQVSSSRGYGIDQGVGRERDEAGFVHGAGDRLECVGLFEDRDRARDRELCPGKIRNSNAACRPPARSDARRVRIAAATSRCGNARRRSTTSFCGQSTGRTRSAGCPSSGSWPRPTRARRCEGARSGRSAS